MSKVPSALLPDAEFAARHAFRLALQAPSPRLPRGSLKMLPFLLVHLVAVAGALAVGVTAADVMLCLAMYYLRMFGVTAGYHRYFAHRSYKTGRVFQFFLAFLAQTSAQKGALWWAAHHRNHHKYSDTDGDLHSPTRQGFFWSHVGWILDEKNDPTPEGRINDFEKFPELRWLNRHHLVPPIVLALVLFALGGVHALVWGFFVSTVLLFHGTFTINSLSHIFGSRRYATRDTSKNNFLLAMLTMGEGWHNNHHHYCSSANQGFYWWELDPSHLVLRMLSVIGLVWDLRKPPQRVLDEGRRKPPEMATHAVVVPVAAEPAANA